MVTILSWLTMPSLDGFSVADTTLVVPEVPTKKVSG